MDCEKSFEKSTTSELANNKRNNNQKTTAHIKSHLEEEHIGSSGGHLQESTRADNSHGKENQTSNRLDQPEQEKFCFECNRSLAKSRHFINIAGQLHRWHPECFRCHVCNHSLESETSCHIYRDKIFCRNDYAKLQRDNSTKCARCRWPIAALDWVRRAGKYVYHLACFSCDICLRQLSTGEQFTIDVQEKDHVRLLCRLHFSIDQYQQHDQPTASRNHLPASGFELRSASSPSASLASAPLPLPPLNGNQGANEAPSSSCFNERRFHQQLAMNNYQTSNFNRDRYLHLLAAASSNATSMPIDSCINQAQISAHHTELTFGTSELAGSGPSSSNCLPDSELSKHQLAARRTGAVSTSSSNGSSTTNHLIGSGSGAHSSKSKRVRTTFTEDQVSILQTHFHIDSNPDGQDLERIATITGLSKRVTQVWFQNSRARQKKFMVKRKPSSSVLNVSAVGSHAPSSGFANLQPPSHLTVNTASHQMLSDQSLSGIVEPIDKEAYQSGAFAAREEKGWPSNLSNRSESDSNDREDSSDGNDSLSSTEQLDRRNENDMIASNKNNH